LINRRLQHAALTDELTHLANRRAGLTALAQAWSAAMRHEYAVSVISIDVDLFKIINDSYGHAVGDIVLQRISECLRDAARREDTVARWGGEEFLVICPKMDLRAGMQAAERFRKLIASLCVPAGHTHIGCTVSLGLACWRSDMSNPDQLLAEADNALYAAKKGGRNRVGVATQGKVRIFNSG
ncbi:MAG: GGDEF domain-containing protein, partial [Rhodoferax sp.]